MREAAKPRGSDERSGGKRAAGKRTYAEWGASGRDRRSLPGSIWSRIKRTSARTLILLVLFVFFIVLSVSPVTRNLEATNHLREVEGELKKQKAITESLQRDVAEAQSLQYVEKEARRQRKVAPGEILYIVTSDNSDNEVKYRIKALQSMDEAWEHVRQMLHSVPRVAEGVPSG